MILGRFILVLVWIEVCHGWLCLCCTVYTTNHPSSTKLRAAKPPFVYGGPSSHQVPTNLANPIVAGSCLSNSAIFTTSLMIFHETTRPSKLILSRSNRKGKKRNLDKVVIVAANSIIRYIRAAAKQADKLVQLTTLDGYYSPQPA